MSDEMREKIEPALTEAAWASVRGGNGIPYGYGSSVLDDLNILQGPEIPAAIAYLNDRLPDDDPRKITRATMGCLRHWAGRLTLEGAGEDELNAIADALESYRPPEGA